jgi:hypothetical protein
LLKTFIRTLRRTVPYRKRARGEILNSYHTARLYWNGMNKKIKAPMSWTHLILETTLKIAIKKEWDS